MSQPSETDIQQIFDRIAPVYDRFNDLLSLGQHRIWKKMALRWCEPQQGEKWLDLCCGSGDMTALVAQKVAPTGQVIGVDFSKELLAIAADKAKNYSPKIQKCLTWQQGNVLHLPFADNSFNGATLAYGLRNVASIPQCLSELHRVLQNGSKVAILDFHRPSDRLMQTFQDFYLAQVVVPLADRFEMTDEYAYIAPSLARFPIGSEQVKLAKAAGFSQAKHYAIANGMMGILVLQK
ncbi:MULTISPECIES: bifunctional demethylmenaquinone methyltransferase/2-methoxy-6-polyprenyl-1,4-benzoquinol methylase UbiE [Pseudanabaena]|jgi:demethylphylloquinol methyltransferase|uniref:bifunctional demethylmenaquinone methyltransferase/2-methoxy-6-polyprenyl-1,4-benzoquinol methylase UbiE n=1 Tax=Pseudanabaena TaxID=1152 RepID=UPI00247AADAF|nr:MULTISPECIES: bifunctional demethylmenaquinone methyltransferase/2-methoxy-6-polyprenyl-1,4-benzoquinol methylase UbiE [Pseudanabaena]MEA5490059.1 bifunctional demethylmenaquinone methyltransferase/2-methoxy-6-polyprenyl-1,4-benzoquinol methylase UbiE [Pseudanabaena sp. CCNP1317]WGS71855.1 bifunctional demethylmenaquinone methyltransferase/2-methoxy-6-polyprenyl-1,4-benzoquinol methylase UbiE [Pseudanabaena galeata CCNP1313]